MGSLFFYRHFSLPIRHGRRLFFSTKPISSGIYRNIEANHSLRSTESTGLYGFDILSSPQGFRKFALDAIQRSEELITHIKMLPPSEEVIRAVDDIFNTVDTVVSSVELCISTHPDREYVEEAERAHVKMSEHLFYLCSNRELYAAVSESNNKTGLRTDEAQRAARTLQIDFEKFGTHLCQDKQALVTQLNIEIQDLSNQFVSNILNYPGEFDVFPASQIPKWLHSQFQKIESMNGTSLSKSKPEATTSGLRIVTRPEVLNEILNWTEDEQIRKQAYITGNSTPKINLTVLDKLIAARHNLSQTLGYPSYSDFVLAPTMASSTDVVMSFLNEMSNLIKNKADKERESMRALKRQKTNGVGDIEPWDEQFYVCLVRDSECHLESAGMGSYFSLPNCLEGLNLIVKSLFGASFDKVPLAPGESWHPNVQKLVLHHPEEGDLGCIYLDLYARKCKPAGCSVRVLRQGKLQPSLQFQRPVVALLCDFSIERGTNHALLSHGELETLFHEFGHALHHLFSRTDYYCVSGARTALDFVEIPSHLFEYFAADYRVLKKFAKHYLTGEAIPESLVKSMTKAKKLFDATDLQRQVVYSIIDQSFFGKQPSSSVDTISMVENLTKKYTSWRNVQGTHWYTRFHHLLGYGAGYYSYLYARCFASSIWKKVCSQDPLSLEAGSIIRNELLKHGGSKDPTMLLREIIGETALKECHAGGVKPNIDDLFEELEM